MTETAALSLVFQMTPVCVTYACVYLCVHLCVRMCGRTRRETAGKAGSTWIRPGSSRECTPVGRLPSLVCGQARVKPTESSCTSPLWMAQHLPRRVWSFLGPRARRKLLQPCGEGGRQPGLACSSCWACIIRSRRAPVWVCARGSWPAGLIMELPALPRPVLPGRGLRAGPSLCLFLVKAPGWAGLGPAVRASPGLRAVPVFACQPVCSCPPGIPELHLGRTSTTPSDRGLQFDTHRPLIPSSLATPEAMGTPWGPCSSG